MKIIYGIISHVLHNLFFVTFNAIGADGLIVKV